MCCVISFFTLGRWERLKKQQNSFLVVLVDICDIKQWTESTSCSAGETPSRFGVFFLPSTVLFVVILSRLRSCLGARERVTDFIIVVTVVVFFNEFVVASETWTASRRTVRRAELRPALRVFRRCRRAWAACWTRAAARGGRSRGCTPRRPWSRTTWGEERLRWTELSPPNRPTWTRLWLCSGKRWWETRVREERPAPGGFSFPFLLFFPINLHHLGTHFHQAEQNTT